MDKWNGMNLRARDQHALGNHSNAMSACGQGDERLRSGALEGDVRSDTRRLAGGVQPFPLGKGASEQQ